jgi:aminoglycoside 6'-N-acetyltransferase
MESQIILRNATIEDLDMLRYWDTKQHNIESDPNNDWSWETELKKQFSWRELLIAEINNRPIGFMQIIDPYDEETHYWGEIETNLRAIDIWLGEEYDMGKGYGTIMMQMAFERCFRSSKVNAVIIDPLVSNVRAHKFYERLGFEFIEKRTFGEDDCFIYRLDR